MFKQYSDMYFSLATGNISRKQTISLPSYSSDCIDHAQYDYRDEIDELDQEILLEEDQKILNNQVSDRDCHRDSSKINVMGQ